MNEWLVINRYQSSCCSVFQAANWRQPCPFQLSPPISGTHRLKTLLSSSEPNSAVSTSVDIAVVSSLYKKVADSLIDWLTETLSVRCVNLQLGPDWRSVVDLCVVGRYQPLLLLYANSTVELIDVSTAPAGIIRIPKQMPAIQGSIHTHTRTHISWFSWNKNASKSPNIISKMALGTRTARST